MRKIFFTIEVTTTLLVAAGSSRDGKLTLNSSNEELFARASEKMLELGFKEIPA
jgi:hypothetical protein